MLISVEEKVKISWTKSGDYGRCSSVVTISVLKNPRPKPTGVLEHCREGETKSWFSFLGGVSF